MADEFSNLQSTEYKSSDDQTADYAASSSPQIPNQQMVIERLKKMLIPVFFVVAIYMVYSVLSWVSGHKADVSSKQQQLAQQAAAPIVLTNSTPNIDAQLADFSQAVKQQLTDIAQQLSDNRDQIAGLKDAVAKNQADMADMQQSVNKSVESMEQKVTGLQKSMVVKKKSKAKVKVQKQIIAYSIRAIVPGRVWIESKDGATLSLRTGDKLEGYGVVELISPRDGLVVTSSGRTIQYGSNDI